ncbi:MAG: UDP-2,4-diacetamido-2,4,6-trideoxy-beta-L-altropyranose hydrolase [Lachnospiraceae bacterium]|nr:UDP-2,4-diacetamido-2,4,6-trideoxy-beta-L-altropyranose hydrolase [Lachnospiraceae bacterium]
MKKIIIRADGNAKIGAGHLMRCLTVAENIDENRVLFICADEESAKLAMDHGFQGFVLNTDYRDMMSELPLWQQMKEQNVGGLGTGEVTILVDSYYVNNEYLLALKCMGKVVILDDMAQDVKAADSIINYNAFAYPEMYEGLSGAVDTIIYTGSTYIPIRPDFVARDYTVAEKVRKVLITTGGGDRDNIAGQILDTIYESGIFYQVVTGRFNPHYKTLQKYAESHPGVEILHDVKDMAGLMLGCDLAITAGGTTVYELCSIGVPFICFSYAENQEKLVEYVGREKIALSAGKYHWDAAKCLSEIRNGFERLRGDFLLRKECSEKEKRIVDGQGAKRIARILEN